MATSFKPLSYPHPRRCPSRVEVISIRDRIRKLDSEILKVDGQNKGAQIQLANLHYEKENLTSYISPFRSLPIEIMTEILRLCLESGVRREKLMKICGTLRDVVTGTPTFWNKIQICYWGQYKASKGTNYSKIQHLEFALLCAGPTPLDLRIDSKSCSSGFRFDRTTVISSRKCAVRSLSIHISHEEEAIYSVLQALDMSTLKDFSLEGCTIDKLGKFLDLAMQSSQEQMTIGIDARGKGVDTLLQHGLLRRATKLFLSIESDDSLVQ